MKLPRAHPAVWSILLALVITACEAPEADPAAEQEPEAPVAEQAAARDTAAALAPEPGTMVPIDRSGVRGSVRVDGDDDELDVVLSLEGLEPGGTYTAVLHEGRCAAGGPVVIGLGDVEAAEDGTASAQLGVLSEQLDRPAARFVQVNGPDGAPVSCADLATGPAAGVGDAEAGDPDGVEGG